MREHTRKHHTERANRANIASEVDSPMSAEEALHILIGNEAQPAVMLRGLRYRDGLTQVELGNLLGTAQANISLMEKGKKTIGKTIAKRLADIFKTDYRLFL
jgi:DNA-binding XRE family transcriptional regulator